MDIYFVNIEAISQLCDRIQSDGQNFLKIRIEFNPIHGCITSMFDSDPPYKTNCTKTAYITRQHLGLIVILTPLCDYED